MITELARWRENIFWRIFDTEGDKIIVFQGVEGSPISEDRLRGFTEAVKKKVKENDIVYYYGELVPGCGRSPDEGLPCCKWRS